MKLTDLDAEFVRHTATGFQRVLEFSAAQGVVFVCPLAGQASCSGHSILVWFAGRGVPDAAAPEPRWSASGTGLDDLTLSPSINLDVPPKEGGQARGCRWHGHVRDGDAS